MVRRQNSTTAEEVARFQRLFPNYQDYQDYQDPSMQITVMDGHRQGKKQMFINTPSHSSSDDQASS